MLNDWIPRELAFLDAHVPTLFAAFLLAVGVIWFMDKWLAAWAIYERVWYPAVFGLMVY